MPDPDTTDIQTSRFVRSAAEDIRERTFPVVVRGYDRRAVDDFLQEVAALVIDLEGRQTRETVVQRALNEVGEETAGILQRAHETADEIAARSRAQAEGRIQRAEREAEIIRRQAEEFSEKVVVDTRLLWEERQRLIEDIRQLADEVLATADDAAERVELPEPLAAEDAAQAAEAIPLQSVAPGEPEPGFSEPVGPDNGFEDPAGLDPAYGQPGDPEPAYGQIEGPENGFGQPAGPAADEAPTELFEPPTAEFELDVLEGGAGQEGVAPDEADTAAEPGELAQPSEPDEERREP